MAGPGRLLTAGLLVATSLVAVGGDDIAHAATTFDLTAPGPNGPVTIIGDSVLNGAGVFGPTLPDQLSARGWGPIRFRAAGSATSGKFPVANEFRSSFWIDRWQSEGWDPEHVIVNLGVNDSGFCGTNAACARDTILHMVESIGPGHQIWWPTIMKPSAPSRDVFNSALEQIAAERNDFHVWDWFAEFAAGGYRSGDQIHLDPESYRKRSDRMAEVFTNTLGPQAQPPPPPVAERTGDDAPLPEPTAQPSSFTALAPRRVHDTRLEDGTRVAAGHLLTVDFGDQIPSDASAVAIYVAAIGAGNDGYLSARPCAESDSGDHDAGAGDAAGATVNFAAGPAVGAPTVTAIGANGDVCILASTDVHVTVDLQGVFTPGAAGLEMNDVSQPLRLADTRPHGQVTELQVMVRTSLDAAVVNLAAVGADSSGFLSASPCGERSGVANVNFSRGVATSASAFVPLDEDGTFCITSSTPVDIVVDLNATLSSTGTLSYIPVAPTRMVDTRDGTGGWGPIHPVGDSLDWRVAPDDARAATGTLTIVRPESTAYATAWLCSPDAPAPSTAVTNSPGGGVAANSLTSAVLRGTGRLCLFASSTMHTVFDVNGWWVDST